MNKYQASLDFLRDGEDSNMADWDLLQELVDRATPMRPVIEQGALSYYSGVGLCRDYYVCPKCGEEVGRGDNKANHCPDCGQVIDWSE